jgi:hypothetical protein
MSTPFFPQWRPRLAALGQRVQPLQRATLDELELFFAGVFPRQLLSQADEGPNSRERDFPIRRTFWLFLAQVLTPHTSCRAVVRQAQALLGLHSEKQIDSASSAYVSARHRLPAERLEQALRHSATTADQRCRRPRGSLAGRPVKVVDATSTQLPDTPENQRRYPQPSTQKPGCGFPVMKVMALFSLTSGALLHVIEESLHWHDVRLFRRLWDFLCRNDIVVGDRAFSDYVSLASLPQKAVDVICRLPQTRRPDFRRGQQRLGKHDALFTWTKPSLRPNYLTKRQWKSVPEQLTVRLVRRQISQRGFRTRQLTLVTTLLDPKKYPADELVAVYQRRWRLELCFRDLKTTMGMETMSCRSPQMVHKELLMYLIAHNLIRCLMAEAASLHDVELDRLSFKGAVDATRHFSNALAKARTKKQRRRLEAVLLKILAEDQVPDRPNRREPRAVKRRPKPYPLLTRPRGKYKEIPHRSRYSKKTTPKSMGLI